MSNFLARKNLWKFGTVQITVHDSRVVQVERVEKLRFDKPEPGGG